MTHGPSGARPGLFLLTLLPRLQGPHRLLPFVLFAVVLGACGGGGDDAAPEPTLSREAFISTYVDLRMAALRNPETEITVEERERILEEHGVSSEELLRFVEVLSRDDPRTMQEIWAEVQDRIRQAREDAAVEEQPGDTTAVADPDPTRGRSPIDRPA